MSTSYTALNEQKRQCAKRCRPRAGRRSFTLIELLVVVAIIALLISILLPSLNAARDASKRSVCMANLHGIGLALVSYANTWQSYLPGYDQIGRVNFRVRFGNKVTMPTGGSMVPTPYSEVFGVNAILHTDTFPRKLPNTIFYNEDPPEPVFCPGDSKVWICPSNLGPMNLPEFRNYGNSYAYFCNRGNWDPNRPNDYTTGSAVYNLDRVAADPKMRSLLWKTPLLWDAYNNKPGWPAQMPPIDGGGSSLYSVAATEQRQPHRASGFMNKGASGTWIAYYPDGHCQMNGFNK